MKHISIISATIFALVSTTAFAADYTFKDPAGNAWTLTNPEAGEVSNLYMSPDAGQACPGRRVKFEASKLGPKMTKEQKFRGDKRWHIVCDRSAPRVEAAPVAPPAASVQPAPQQQTQQPPQINPGPRTYDVGYKIELL